MNKRNGIRSRQQTHNAQNGHVDDSTSRGASQDPLDGAVLLRLLDTPSVNARLENAVYLLDCLQSEHENAVDTRSISLSLDHVVPHLKAWVSCPNNAVRTRSLDLISLIADRAESDSRLFLPFIRDVVDILVARFTDKKQDFRDSIIVLLQNFVLVTIDTGNAQSIMERVVFQAQESIKNANIQLAVLRFLAKSYETKEIRDNVSVAKLVPFILKHYASHHTASIRDQASDCLCVFYKYNGTRVQNDIIRRYHQGGYDATRLDGLLAQFHKITISTNAAPSISNNTNISKVPAVPNKRVSSASSLVTMNNDNSSTEAGTFSSRTAAATSLSTANTKGANDVESFKQKYFQNLVAPHDRNSKSLDQIRALVCAEADRDTQSQNWEQRVSAFRQIRWFIQHGQLDETNDEFWREMRQGFPLQVKDARSQVQVEACITCAFVAERHPTAARIFGAELIEALFTLIRSTVKVVSSSGWTTLQLFLAAVSHSSFIPVILENRKAKSKAERLKCYEVLAIILRCWPEKTLKSQKYKALIIQSISDGFTDSDASVRKHVRDCWSALTSFYPVEANSMRNSLSSTQQKQLDSAGSRPGSRPTSSASSRNSMAPPHLPRPKTSAGSEVRSSNALEKHQMRLVPPKTAAMRKLSRDSIVFTPTTTNSPLRSFSAIDQAAASASARKYGNVKSKINCGFTPQKGASSGSIQQPLRRLRKNSNSSIDSGSSTQTRKSAQEAQRPTAVPAAVEKPSIPVPKSMQYRGRKPRASMSTPGSRHESPDRTLTQASAFEALIGNKATMRTPRSTRDEDTRPSENTPGRAPRSTSRQRRSRIPRSNQGSRPPSRDPSPGSTAKSKVPGNVLQNGPAAEKLIADRLHNVMRNGDTDRRSQSPVSHHSYSENDINDILLILATQASNAPKDIFNNLIEILNGQHTLTRGQVYRVKEIVAKLLAEANPRLIPTTLDITTSYVLNFHAFIQDWLFILLKQVLRISSLLDSKQQMPTNLSIAQKKLLRTTASIRAKFPVGAQFDAVAEYLTGPTQMIDSKLKYTVLRYLLEISPQVERLYSQILQGNPPASAIVQTLEISLLRTMSKILDISSQDRSPEVRTMADCCFVRFFKTNPSQNTLLFQKMGTVHQAMSSKVLRNAEMIEADMQQAAYASESTSISKITREINALSSGDAHGHFQEAMEFSEDVSAISSHSERSGMASESGTTAATNSSSSVQQHPHGVLKAGQPQVSAEHVSAKNSTTDHYYAIPTNPVSHLVSTEYSPITNYNKSPSMQTNHNILQEHDIRQSVELVLSWNSATMQPSHSALLTALSKLRSHSTSEIHENQGLRERILTELCSIIMANGTAGKTIDYATRAMDAICKREIEFDKGRSYSFCLTLLIANTPEDGSDTIDTTADSQNDAGYQAAIHAPWPDCFAILLNKIRANINVLKLFADRIKMRCEPFEGNDITSDEWIKRLSDPLCELCNSDLSQVRKNAIFSLVELVRHVGEEQLRPILIERLQPSKLKLVNLYISRMTK